MKNYLIIILLIISSPLKAEGLNKETVIYTQDGYKKLEEIQIGDTVLICFGDPAKCTHSQVVEISSKVQPAYAIKTSHGTVYSKGNEKLLVGEKWSHIDKNHFSFLNYYKHPHIIDSDLSQQKAKYLCHKYGGFKELITLSLDSNTLIADGAPLDLPDSDISLIVKLKNSAVSISGAVRLKTYSKTLNQTNLKFINLCKACIENSPKTCSSEIRKTIEALNAKYANNTSTHKIPLTQWLPRHCEDLEEDLDNQIAFDLRNQDIKDLSPLEGFSDIEILHLEGNNISDISSLKTMNGLLEVHLQDNPIKDLSPIEDLDLEIFIDQTQNLNIMRHNDVSNASFSLEIIDKNHHQPLAAFRRPRLYDLIQSQQIDEIKNILDKTNFKFWKFKDQFELSPKEYAYSLGFIEIYDLLDMKEKELVNKKIDHVLFKK